MASPAAPAVRSHYFTAHEIGAVMEGIAVPRGAVAYKVVVDEASTASCGMHGSWPTGETPSYGAFDAGYVSVPPGYSSETEACRHGTCVWLSAQTGVDADIQIDWSII